MHHGRPTAVSTAAHQQGRGLGGANVVGDVHKIAYLLNIIAHGQMLPTNESEISKPALTGRIKFVRLTPVGMQVPDGNIGPKGATLRALGRQAALLVIAKKTASTVLPLPMLAPPPALTAFPATLLTPFSMVPAAPSSVPASIAAPQPPPPSSHRQETDTWISAIQARLLQRYPLTLNQCDRIAL